MPGPLEPRGAMTTVNVSMPRVMAQELTRLGAETRAGRAAVVRAAIERGLPLLKLSWPSFTTTTPRRRRLLLT